MIAGGPCTVNPEPMSRFFDLFVIGDGEEALPAVCDAWIELKKSKLNDGRESMLLEMARRFPSYMFHDFTKPFTFGRARLLPSREQYVNSPSSLGSA